MSMKPQHEGTEPEEDLLEAASYAFHDAIYRAQVSPEEDAQLQRRLVAMALMSVSSRGRRRKLGGDALSVEDLRLTSEERQVVGLWLEGKNNSDIASERQVSVEEVDEVMRRLMRRNGVTSERALEQLIASTH